MWAKWERVLPQAQFKTHFESYQLPWGKAAMPIKHTAQKPAGGNTACAYRAEWKEDLQHFRPPSMDDIPGEVLAQGAIINRRKTFKEKQSLLQHSFGMRCQACYCLMFLVRVITPDPSTRHWAAKWSFKNVYTDTRICRGSLQSPPPR